MILTIIFIIIFFAGVEKMKGEIQMSNNFAGKTVATFIVYEIAKELSKVAVGDMISFVADDVDYLEKDIESWCSLTGNKLVSTVKSSGKTTYAVAKGDVGGSSVKKMTVVLSSDGLLELLSPLGFSLAAALSNIEVSIYFQGDAVKVLKKGYEPKLKDPIASLFSGAAVAGLNEIGHIPPQDKVRELSELGAKLYACGPSMDNFKVKKTELFLDGITVCEYFTFLIAMKDADILIYQ